MSSISNAPVEVITRGLPKSNAFGIAAWEPTAKIALSQRGDYSFRLAAYAGTSVAENYERVVAVQPHAGGIWSIGLVTGTGLQPSGLQPSFVRRILDGLRQLAGEQVAQTAPVLLCGTPARFHLRRLLEPFLPKVVVLSPLEIPPMVPVQSLGTVR